MRISSVSLKDFRRFTSLELRELPGEAKLVVLAGPNGSGKSSIFDAFLLKYRSTSNYAWSQDGGYYNKPTEGMLGSSIQGTNFAFNNVSITMHNNATLARGAFYIRTAYRNDPEFVLQSLSRVGPVFDDLPLMRLIEVDATVGKNYQRLAAHAMEDIFLNESETTTIGDFRERVVGECRDPLRRLFPDLTFVGLGNPLDKGTFQFDKGVSKGFDYKNLSGGEKAAFDLILDFVVKRKSYKDTIFCIDEPETHMNTKLQGALLQELLALVPENSQLWIASHSIGMMRKSREIYYQSPGSVVFLDFSGHDFDAATVITPSKPTRDFWKRVLHVALDDLAALIAPAQVVLCEGSPSGATNKNKNAEHDARIYSIIFSEEFPEVTFLSSGSSSHVTGDFWGIASALPQVVSGMKVNRLIDRDDHSDADIACFVKRGTRVLGRRHLEAYLYDDEVLSALCASVGQPEAALELMEIKKSEIAASIARGHSANDIKSATPNIYVKAKQRLGLIGVGNDPMSFARNTLAPLVKPESPVYQALKRDIFG